MLFLALGDAKVPDARYFAFWWNIGFRRRNAADKPSKDIDTLSCFQRQLTILILDYFNAFGFRNILVSFSFEMATVAIAEFMLSLKNVPF